MAFSRIFSVQTWFSVGIRRRPVGVSYWIYLPFAVAVGIYVVTAATFIIIQPWTLVVLFFAGMMALAFLTTGPFETSNPEKPSVLDFLLALASIVV
ncbi:MAG: hypothetical protein ACR2OW_01780, partial [Methyloligellaceae bacterium]